VKEANFNMKYKTEAFDVWQYLCADVYEPLIRCRIDFNGLIDEKILKQAVEASCKTLPMVRLCFCESPGRPQWTDKGFTADDMVRVIEAGENAETEILRCLSTGIDFTREPQLKLFIIRKPDGDTLCAVFCHIVCDGAGFKQYLYLLSQLYTQLMRGDPIAVPEFLPRGTKPLFADTTLSEKLKILRSHYGAYIDSNQAEQQGIDFQQGGSAAIMQKRMISLEEFDGLKFFAKSQGATINDGLMAAFARSFCKNTNTDKIMLPSTIDLRKFIPQSERYGFSNVFLCPIRVGRENHVARRRRDRTVRLQPLVGGGSHIPVAH